MAIIDTVTGSDTDHSPDPAADPPATPGTASAAAGAAPAAPAEKAAVRQVSASLVVALASSIIVALLGGMFLLIDSALDDISNDIDRLSTQVAANSAAIDDLRSEFGDKLTSEIGDLRSEMRTMRSEMQAVLLDHTDRLARIETKLGIEGRPLPTEGSTS